MSLDIALRRIDEIELSVPQSHDRWCCRAARSAILGRFVPVLDLGSALAAVPQTVTWSPTSWPLWWCQLDRRELKGDCGVHAALAGALLDVCSVGYRRGRVALAPPAPAGAHWRATWRAAGLPDHWIGTTAVHHEVVKIGTRWWDPSGASWFVGPGTWLRSGVVLAVREEGGTWQLGDRYLNNKIY